MKRLYYSFILLGSLVATRSFGQTDNQDYYRNPLEFPIQLAADFGELRSNHYHMGLDIRTQQVENKPIHAAADGYVSRVYISPSGYGNMMMVAHPNGTTTLYAHLNKYYDQLTQYVKAQQYKSKSWEQDLTIPAGMFPVSKGQLIALSGNTGGSEGPHLHFEIRDSKTGNHYNPQLKGIKIPDNIDPIATGFFWYDRRFSTYQTGANVITLRKNAQGYETNLVKVPTPVVGLGIVAKDKTSNSPFYFGIYSAQVFLDGKQLFQFRLNNFDNALSRYVNAGTDYKRIALGGSKVQYLFVLPGNKLKIFDGTVGDGSINLTDTLVHDVLVKFADAEGNESTIKSQVQFAPNLEKDPNLSTANFQALPNKPGHFQTANAHFIYSENAFYDIVPFNMTESAATSSLQLSPTLHLGNSYIPVHDFYSVGINYQGDPSLKVRVLLQLKSGRSTSVVKGSWSGNHLVGNFNRLGDVAIILDTVPPNIVPVNVRDNMVLVPGGKLVVRVNDNLGDFQSFVGTVDGNWLLFSRRGNTFTYENDEHFPVGEHTVAFAVTDIAGNQTVKQFKVVKK
ncbi:MAG: peptidoglycan DD-metalloendopeptidase family protein [Chitinophagaceae bacterium]